MFCRKRTPVFGVHKWRGRYCYFRLIGCHNALRADFNIREEGEPRIRPARRVMNITTSWDDLPRCIQRSWKAHRRTQYR